MFHCGCIDSVSGTTSITMNYISPFLFYFATVALPVDKTCSAVVVSMLILY